MQYQEDSSNEGIERNILVQLHVQRLQIESTQCHRYNMYYSFCNGVFLMLIPTDAAVARLLAFHDDVMLISLLDHYRDGAGAASKWYF